MSDQSTLVHECYQGATPTARHWHWHRSRATAEDTENARRDRTQTHAQCGGVQHLPGAGQPPGQSLGGPRFKTSFLANAPRPAAAQQTTSRSILHTRVVPVSTPISGFLKKFLHFSLTLLLALCSATCYCYFDQYRHPMIHFDPRPSWANGPRFRDLLGSHS